MKVAGIVYPGSASGPACGPARDGGVFVMREKCATCIFHSGNLMHLNPGTVKEMKESADRLGSCIVCHEGMDGPHSAVCRGYYDNHKSYLLQMAERMGFVKFEGASKEQGA